MEKKNNPLAPYECQFDTETRKRMLAEMLIELRKTRGLQQKEVAAILGVSPQTYNGYEKGRNEPPIEIIVRMSYLYNLPVDMLVQRDRLHAYDKSAKESVEILEKEIAAIREGLKAGAIDQAVSVEQLQGVLTAMERLTEISKQIVDTNTI